MKKLSSFLRRGASHGAIPIALVTEKSFGPFVRKQKASVRNWLAAQKFKPAPGRFSLVPDAGGRVGLVVACLSDPVSLWDLSSLADALPKGVYRLETALAAADEKKLLLGWLLGGYRFGRYKKGEEPKATLCHSKKIDTRPIVRMAQAITLVRDMITTPASDMGPEEIASIAKELAQAFGAKMREIVGDALLKKNYPAIHAVGRGSARAPRLIDLTWGDPKRPKVTLVGKGVCFDTGGLDLKPSSNMYLMRKDMGGAAVALGVASLVMAAKLPVRLRLLIPAVENAVDGTSYRPSDILTMRDGTTVEIGNTDAEGRLVLADALAEASSEKPALLIDFATLTGAARAAVGTEISALFANDEKLAAELFKAGEASEDPLWRLPLHKPYENMMKSAFAEVNSCPSSGYAGAITAALFLQRFAMKAKMWAHLDFMGWNLSSKPGRPEGGEAMALRAVFAMLEKRFPRV